MFEFLTKIDKSKIEKLKTFQIKKIFVPMIFISLGILACGIVNIVRGQLGFGITWTILGIIYVPSVFIFTKLSNNFSTYYDHLKYSSLYEKFYFSENTIIIVQLDEKDNSSESRFKYDEIYKIYKSKDDYFLYVNKERVHILPVSLIKGGEPEKFEEMLKSKLQKKYKKLPF